MSDANPKYQRSIRNFLIEPMAQVRMGLRVIVIAMAFLVAMTLVITSGFFTQYTMLIDTNFQPGAGSSAGDLVMEVFFRHTIALSVIFVTFIIVLIGAVIYYTHRIYGAMVALRRFIDDLSAGNYDKRCQLRATDELQSLAESLNGLAQTLQTKYGK